MKLRDLDAQFLQYDRHPVIPTEWVNGMMHPDGFETLLPNVATLAEAHGIWFLCPKCYAANGGRKGTHGIICWFEGRVPDSAQPGPGRWNPVGTGIDDLSFVPGIHSHSVLLLGGCRWHGFVSAGDAT
jgi:hypothetical protein